MLDNDEWVNSPFRLTNRDGDFEEARLFAHPGPLERFDSERRKKVCVVGGGIAGLVAAFELTELGHKVTLLEGSERFGGRILTHRFSDGTYGELGAMRIPENHLCVDHYVKEFGLPYRTFVPRNLEAWFLLRETKERRKDWPNIVSKYDVRPHRSDSPDTLLAYVVDAVKATFVLSDAEIWGQFANRLNSSNLRLLEKETLGQFLSRVFGSGPLLTDEEWEYVGRTTNHLWIEQTPLLHWLREGEILDHTGKYELVGGMDRLTEAFVTRLTNSPHSRIHLQSQVKQIALSDPDVQVRWFSDGLGIQSEDFDFVICAIPGAATLRIEFDPALPKVKREALSNLSYVSAGKTLMHCSVRHWELFDRIFGGNSVTDLPHQQSWYPSDNASARFGHDDDPGDGVGTPTRLGSFADRVRSPDMDAYWDGVDEDVSRGPGVFLAAYLWGTNARRFASLNDEERTELIVASVQRVHRDNEKYLDRDPVHWSWDEQSSPGGGAFAFFKSGEQRRYQEGLCLPLADARWQNRVFFAGEHIGIAHGWIQSAIQTALSAAISIAGSP